MFWLNFLSVTSLSIFDFHISLSLFSKLKKPSFSSSSKFFDSSFLFQSGFYSASLHKSQAWVTHHFNQLTNQKARIFTHYK